MSRCLASALCLLGVHVPSAYALYYNLGAFWRMPTITQFGVSTPSWPEVNQCVPITITAEGSAGEALAPTQALTITLSGAGSGAFYGTSDTTCSSSAITSVDLPIGQSSVIVYYQDTTYEQLTLTATSGSVTGTDGIYSQAVYKVSTADTTFYIGTCTLFTVNVVDYNGDPVTIHGSQEPINLQQEYWRTYDNFYAGTDTTCTGTPYSYTYIPVGSSSLNFYYIDNLAESNVTMNAYAQDDDFISGSEYPIDIVAPVAPENLVITGPTYFLQNTCMQFTVLNVDLSNYTEASTSSASTINLASSLGGSFYGSSDTTCGSSAVTSVTLPANESSVTFHFMDSSVENPVFTASGTGFTNGTFNANSGSSLPTILLGSGNEDTYIAVNGDLTSFGDNSSGELGSGSFSPTTSPLPVQVSGITSGTTGVSGGSVFTCAVVSGYLQCWGGGADGVLDDQTYGSGNVTNTPNSPRLSGTTYFESGAREGDAACALVSGGVECWGINDAGMMGVGDTNSEDAYPNPTWVTGLGSGSGVSQIVAGASHALALLNGGVLGWGGNGYGALDESGNSYPSPTQLIAADSGVTQVAVGDDSSCVVIDGGLKCWGIIIDGIGDQVQVVPASSGVTAVAMGDQFACYIKNSAVYCFGDNSNGNYGDGTTNDAGWWSPEATPGYSSNVVAIAAQQDALCAEFSTGDIRCSGTNFDGNLGAGFISSPAMSTPLQIGNIP